MGPPSRPTRGGLDRGPSGPSGEGIFYEVSRAESLPKRINAQDIKRRESDSIDTPDIKRRDSDKRDFEPDKWQFVGSLQDDSRAVPKPSYGTHLFMPIFCPSTRTKLKFFHPVEKVMPFALPVPCLIPLTYKKVINRCRRCIEVGG